LREKASKLQRLLALALNESAADGEALNALRAARKIVKELGGVDKCISVTISESVSAGKQYGGFWSDPFTAYYGPGQGFDAFKESILRAQAEEKRRRQSQEARERAERLRRQAQETMDSQKTNIHDGVFTKEQLDAMRAVFEELLGAKK
jgi:hypothetical protein